MMGPLINALQGQSIFLKIEEELLRQAIAFFRLGFTPDNLSPTQMAAITQCLQSAATVPQATEKTILFLEGQLDKLAKKERLSSWRSAIGGEEEQTTLGDALIDCLFYERYLPKGGGYGLDRLATLRRFWHYVHSQYRYEQNVGGSMFQEEIAV
jgi:hypothetical protein